MTKPQFKTLDKPYSDRPRRERSGDNKFGDRPPRERKFGDNQFNDRPSRERKFGDNQFNDRPPRERKFGDNKFGDRPPRERKFGDKRPRSFERTERSEPRQFFPEHGNSVGNTGGLVKISLKNRPEQTEKKTGPLSPRAPEKIRKNRSEEMKIYGENACLTRFAQSPETIVRLWATVEMSHRLGSVLSYLAEQKKTYHIVSQEELALVAGTEHHGGIAMLVKKTAPLSLEGYLQLPKRQDCVVVLDSVNNAQNIGGILRTCAFYGVVGVVVESAEQLYSSNAARVAEGGLEFVKALETKNKHLALDQLRAAGYQIVHLSRNKQAPHLAKTELREKVAFVLSEIVPMNADNAPDTTVQLSFANPLQSGLNVAVASGVLLGAWYERYAV